MESSIQYSKTVRLIFCAVFASITGITAGLAIPLPFTPVPVTLATLSVMVSGGILGSRYGSLSVLVYIFMGCIGLPVFSGYVGGIGVIFGPTGGYLTGYILTAFVTGFIIERFNRANRYWINATAMTVGTLSCYIPGTLWFMVSTDTPLWASLVSCVFPFLAGDVIKIAVGAFLIRRLRPALCIKR